MQVDASTDVSEVTRPVREYLRSLEWDGSRRLESGPWPRQFLVAAVARALVPGCRVDTLHVFWGAREVGTQALRALLGGVSGGLCEGVEDEYPRWVRVLDGLPSTQKEREDVFAATDNLIVSGGRRRRHREVPCGPSRRVAYGVPRQFLYVAVSSEPPPLEARRLTSVHAAELLDATATEASRDQLWAEAVRTFADGCLHPWRASTELSLDRELDRLRSLPLETAEAELGNAVYAAARPLEDLESVGKVWGNGHHARQRVAEYAKEELRRRWRSEPDAGLPGEGV